MTFPMHDSARAVGTRRGYMGVASPAPVPGLKVWKCLQGGQKVKHLFKHWWEDVALGVGIFTIGMVFGMLIDALTRGGMR